MDELLQVLKKEAEEMREHLKHKERFVVTLEQIEKDVEILRCIITLLGYMQMMYGRPGGAKPRGIIQGE